MHDDPLRAQSLAFAIGGVLATLAVAACAVAGTLRPQGVADSASIVIGRDTGALYVRVEDTLHPVLNLASARLVARSAANPVPSADTAIASAKRGPLMGIPGAPAAIGERAQGDSWTVCDDDRTTVAIGAEDLDVARSARPVLVTPRGESAATTYLLYDGQRAAVDLRNVAVVRALRLNGVVPVPVSRTLLDAVPEVPAIAPPSIPGAGGVGPPLLKDVAVGAVVLVQRADVAEHYVVLREGLQLVGQVAADLIRFTYDGHATSMPTVAPAAVAALPIAATLAVGTFPQHAVAPIGATDGGTVCAQWHPGRSPRTATNTVVTSGYSPYRDRTGVVPLAQADGAGPNVDAVLVAAGRSAYVHSARLVGDPGATGALFLVTDGGVAFGVHDEEAASFLGLGSSPDAAPWSILTHLPRGPELSVEAASVVRDGFAPPS